jgi:hypothetical protein
VSYYISEKLGSESSIFLGYTPPPPSISDSTIARLSVYALNKRKNYTKAIAALKIFLRRVFLL